MNDADMETLAPVADEPKPAKWRGNPIPDTVVVHFDHGQWTDATKDALRTLYNAGYSTAAIGDRLGFSKNSIVGKAHRLGLDARPSPIIRDYVPKPVKPPAVPKTTLPPLASTTPSPVTFRPGFNFVRPVVQPRFAPIARPVDVPKPIVTKPLTAKCLFPMWGDERPTHRYCDAPAALGDPYCAKHHALCFTRAPRREEAA